MLMYLDCQRSIITSSFIPEYLNFAAILISPYPTGFQKHSVRPAIAALGLNANEMHAVRTHTRTILPRHRWYPFCNLKGGIGSSF